MHTRATKCTAAHLLCGVHEARPQLRQVHDRPLHADLLVLVTAQHHHLRSANRATDVSPHEWAAAGGHENTWQGLHADRLAVVTAQHHLPRMGSAVTGEDDASQPVSSSTGDMRSGRLVVRTEAVVALSGHASTPALGTACAAAGEFSQHSGRPAARHNMCAGGAR
jgi:hypothetical protein